MKLTKILTAAVLAGLAFTNVAVAQGTAFTYQGRLNVNTNPAGLSPIFT